MDKTIQNNASNLPGTPALKLALLCLGLAGMGISIYLTYIHLQQQTAICLPTMNCDAVLNSVYAQIWGIPLSLFGLLMYATLTALVCLSLWGKEEWSNLLAMGIYSIALSSLLYTFYLYYLEIFEIHAFCSWCIGSSIVVLFIFILSLINLSTSGLNFKDLPHFVHKKVRRYIQW